MPLFHTDLGREPQLRAAKFRLVDAPHAIHLDLRNASLRTKEKKSLKEGTTMCFRPPSFDDMMKKCPSCGTFNPPENDKCKKCGNDLPTEAPAPGAPAAPGGAPAAPGAPKAPGAPAAPGAPKPPTA